jgi:hypothetical protein
MEVYRAMQADRDGRPLVGRAARMLGVRVPEDIAVMPDGCVVSGSGGMSVSPGSLWYVPSHRRPRGLGRGSTGAPNDRIYRTASRTLSEGNLTLRADPAAPARHALVEPSARMPLPQYEEALHSTRPYWQQEWP